MVNLPKRITSSHPTTTPCSTQHSKHIRSRQGIQGLPEPLDNALRSIDLQNLPTINQRNTITTTRLIHVWSRYQHGDSLYAQTCQHIPKFTPGDRINPCGRLVEKQHRGSMYQSTTQRQFLFHTTGQFASPPFTKWLDLPVNRRYEIVIILDRNSKQSCKKCQILFNRQIGIQRKTSGHIADSPTNLLVIGHNIQPINRSLSTIGNQKRRQQAKQRRFTRTIRTNHPEKLTPTHLKRDPIQGCQLPVTFDQLFGCNSRLHPCIHLSQSFTSP